jgi:hypothetical protein
MKITLCGSIAFYDEMVLTQKKLEALGHIAYLPPAEICGEFGQKIPTKEYYSIRKTTDAHDGWIWKAKETAMREHFNKVMAADAVLILNYSKNGIENYIGGNTLLEMGVAFHLKKAIFLLNPIPEMCYQNEILGLQPLVINGDLTLIKWGNWEHHASTQSQIS